jgi:hypothetical protein
VVVNCVKVAVCPGFDSREEHFFSFFPAVGFTSELSVSLFVYFLQILHVISNCIKEMARTKQTARKCTGGQASRKELGIRAKRLCAEEIITSHGQIVHGKYRVDTVWQQAKFVSDGESNHKMEYVKNYEVPWVVHPDTPACLHPYLCHDKHIRHLKLIPNVFLTEVTKEQRKARDPLYKKYVLTRASEYQLSEAGRVHLFHFILYYFISHTKNRNTRQ